MRGDKRTPLKADKKAASRAHKRGVVGYSKKSALLEEAITQMNAGKYGRSSAALKELLALDPTNTEARRLFATLHLRLGSLMTARAAFESLAEEALQRQDYWLAESLLREYLAAGPRCVPFLDQLAKVYEEKGDAMAAVIELGKAIDVLLEDPDHERPNRPAELYAKIRNLAPASPVAFRLAHLFDAQTGELLAPSPAAPPSEEVAHSTGRSDESIEELSALTGSMPREDVVGTDISTTRQATDDDQSSPELACFPVPSIEQEIDSARSAAETEQDASEQQIDGDLSPDSPLTDESLPADGQGDTHTAIDELPIAQAASVESPTVPNFHGETPAFVHPAEAHPGPPPALSPMPWDQVEEAPISIPEATPASSTSSIELSPAPPEPRDGFESTPDALPELPTPSNDAGADIRELSNIEPAGLSAQPSESPASVSEEPKQEKSSWDNIFYKAWNLTASLTEKAATHAPLHPHGSTTMPHEAPTEPESPTPSLSVEEGPPEAEVRFTDSGRMVVAPPIAAPMPWEDVQETPIAIPTPEPACPTPADAPAYLGNNQPGEEPPEQVPTISSEFDNRIAEETPTESPTRAFRLSPEEAESVPAPPAVPEMEFRYVPPAQAISDGHAPQAAQEATEAPAGHTESPVEAAGPAVIDHPSSISVESDSQESAAAAEAVAPAEEPLASTSVPAPEHQASKQQEAPPPFLTVASSEVPGTTQPGTGGRQTSMAPAAAESARPVVSTAAPGKAVKWDSETISAPPQESANKKAAWEEELSREIIEALSPGATIENDSRLEPWIRTGEQIVLKQPQEPAKHWTEPTTEERLSPAAGGASAAVSAVDVLFDSPPQAAEAVANRSKPAKARRRFTASLSRARQHILLVVGTCFSTTRALVSLCIGVTLFATAAVAVAVGILGLTWVAIEERPNAAFHNFNVTPQRSMTDPMRNGYLLLLGFDAPSERNPVQYGYERRATDSDWDSARTCVGEGQGAGSARAEASASVLHRWFGTRDPAAQFASELSTLKGWATQSSEALSRYKQWIRMPFEDWGYGQQVSPDCTKILFAHRLYVAEGLGQDLSVGLDRLEDDMEAWRSVLAKAKTLPVKMMAREAVTDDIAAASGLMIRPDLDERHVGRLMKMVRPLDQVELSIRWPMQSHFIWATKTIDAVLKNDAGQDRPFYASLATALSLPKQRRFNRYAEYYEAANRAGAEGRATSLPKRAVFVRTPPAGFVDYVMNPIENIIGIEPLPDWDTYNGRMVDVDARLRLVSLQGWARRGEDGTLMTRMAKAGQKYYDPFTGFPMLVNVEKGLMYSVGRDGKDQDADPKRDIVAVIPPGALSKRPFSSPMK